MNSVSNNSIKQILRLMTEDQTIGGSTANLSGARYAQDAENIYQDMGHNTLDGFNSDQQQFEDLDVGEKYTEREVKIAKRFIALTGGGERARDLLEKTIQADQLLGISTSEEEQDRNDIEQIASIIPDQADFPTDYSSRFNPSSNR